MNDSLELVLSCLHMLIMFDFELVIHVDKSQTKEIKMSIYNKIPQNFYANYTHMNLDKSK